MREKDEGVSDKRTLKEWVREANEGVGDKRTLKELVRRKMKELVIRER